jgi:hypothetical protein
MIRILRAAMRLYPAWWRRRYAREFEALLDDMNAGPRELFDVLKGALAMRVKSVGAIPVIGALAGALAGGAMVMWEPDRFASTAIISVEATDSAFAQDVRSSVQKALAQSEGSRGAASVVMAARSTSPAAVQVTYVDRDPAQALRVTESLATAMTTGSARLSGSTRILSGPQLPTSPVERDYQTNVAWGGGIGLVAGALMLAVRRVRRAPPSAG